jgi:hypothetical protein
MCAPIIKPAAWMAVVLWFQSAAASTSAPTAAFDGEATAAGESPGSKTLAPGPNYQAGWLTRFFLGAQWRDMWTTPIEVPVLDLESFEGGLRPERRGGGQQTKSLRLQSGNGRTWSFRSVDKDATGMLDPETRESVLGDIVQDLTSTVHPGAALVVAPLLEAAGVLHATPQLAVMPDDPRLGEFRSAFAGMLGLLEERIEHVPGGGKVEDTIDLFVRLDERAGEEVDARNYLRARLIDILVGDWDRHLDQWRWIRFEEGGKRIWRPVPRDRDQAFSRFGGVIPSVIEYYTKQITGFGASYPAIDKLTFSGRFIDRRFLVWLDAREWEIVTADVVARLTDPVISDAVHRLPPAMYAKGGLELERLLRARRDALAQASRDFYRLLAARVDLRAAEGETLAIKRMAGGNLDVASPLLRRTFQPGETEELRLYTPRGGQVREEGNADSSITVRVVPADPRPPEPVRPRYEPFRDWGQDLLFFPQFSYDSSRGLVLGARAQLTRYGFAFDPFSSQMDFAAAWSTGVNRPRLEYTAKLRTHSSITGLLYLAYSGIEVVSFYGLGNETRNDPALASAGFYSVRQEQLIAYPILQTSLLGPLRGHVGALLKRVSSIPPGTAAGSVYGSESMTLGSGELGLTLDTRAGALSATRGFRLQIIGRHTPAIFGSSAAFSKLRGEASAALGGRLLTDVFLDLHVGAEKNWGTYPFFEAAFLGGSALPPALNLTGAIHGSPLRGYDADRFAGDASVVGNAELRVSLGRFTALLPFRYGLLALADVGRVFVGSESSSRWHTAAGGGIWLAVFASAWTFQVGSSMNAMLVRSDERTAFYLSTGFGL